jgi:hypothetical protein
MTQPPVPDSADWQRRWAIDAGSVTLQPVTRRIAPVTGLAAVTITAATTRAGPPIEASGGSPSRASGPGAPGRVGKAPVGGDLERQGAQLSALLRGRHCGRRPGRVR